MSYFTDYIVSCVSHLVVIDRLVQSRRSLELEKQLHKESRRGLFLSLVLFPFSFRLTSFFILISPTSAFSNLFTYPLSFTA